MSGRAGFLPINSGNPPLPGARICGTWIYRARDAEDDAEDAETRGGDAGVRGCRARGRSMCGCRAVACERGQVWV